MFLLGVSVPSYTEICRTGKGVATNVGKAAYNADIWLTKNLCASAEYWDPLSQPGDVLGGGLLTWAGLSEAIRRSVPGGAKIAAKGAGAMAGVGATAFAVNGVCKATGW